MVSYYGKNNQKISIFYASFMSFMKEIGLQAKIGD